MMNNYVSCEDCVYQNECHQFDAFFGCNNGKQKTEDMSPLLTNNMYDEHSDILIQTKTKEVCNVTSEDC